MEKLFLIQMLKYSKTTQKNLDLLKGKSKRAFEFLLQECYRQGINAQISSSLRKDEAEAVRLYNAKKSKAKHAYESMHFYGLACDMFVNTNGKTDYTRNGEIWKICQELKLDTECGMVWGKSFNDEPHFELSWGKKWGYFYKLYQQNPDQDFVVYKKSNENAIQSKPVLQACNTKEVSVAKMEENAIEPAIDLTKIKDVLLKGVTFFAKEFKEVYKFFLGK